jgi:hypothetical protein
MSEDKSKAQNKKQKKEEQKAAESAIATTAAAPSSSSSLKFYISSNQHSNLKCLLVALIANQEIAFCPGKICLFVTKLLDNHKYK